MAQKLSLKNAIGLHARIEEQKDSFDYCTGRSVCALPMFFKFVRNKIRRGKNAYFRLSLAEIICLAAERP